jgi:Fur family ferric uptake transcriptional regulator
MSPRERYEEHLNRQGMRLTRERSIIVDEVFTIRWRFDAEQLVERLSGSPDGARVSRSTVYRALVELEKAGLIRKDGRSEGGETYQNDESGLL